eukprot:Filipodium_phascolosomae@DN3991_c0_g1_i1.p1
MQETQRVDKDVFQFLVTNDPYYLAEYKVKSWLLDVLMFFQTRVNKSQPIVAELAKATLHTNSLSTIWNIIHVQLSSVVALLQQMCQLFLTPALWFFSLCFWGIIILYVYATWLIFVGLCTIIGWSVSLIMEQPSRRIRHNPLR